MPLLVEHFQSLNVVEIFLRAVGDFIPWSIVENEEGHGEDQRQRERVPNDLAPSLWQVGGLWIAMPKKVLYGGKILLSPPSIGFRGYAVFRVFRSHCFDGVDA